MKERLCEYGDCHETTVAVTMNIPDTGERPAFCCLEHAALWALRQTWLMKRSLNDESRMLMIKVEEALK